MDLKKGHFQISFRRALSKSYFNFARSCSPIAGDTSEGPFKMGGGGTFLIDRVAKKITESGTRTIIDIVSKPSHVQGQVISVSGKFKSSTRWDGILWIYEN